MRSEYHFPTESSDESLWRVFKGRRPLARAAQTRALGARPRVSRAAATLPFRDGLPFPAGVHSIYAWRGVPARGRASRHLRLESETSVSTCGMWGRMLGRG